MSFNNRSTVFSNIFVALLLISFLLPSAIFSQNITLTVGDATGRLGDSLVPLDIHISNVSDTIAGFEIWLQLDRPDIVKFQESYFIDYDTVYWRCIQYSGADCIDSTLSSAFGDWDFFHTDSTIHDFILYDEESFIIPSWGISTRTLGGQGFDLNIISVYNLSNPEYIVPPQNNELLIRVYLEVVDAFVLLPEDSVVNIYLNTDFISNFAFSTPSGDLIGMEYEYVTDTTCWVCTQWVGDVCLSWEQAPLPGECDSLEIVETIIGAELDQTYWQFNNGSFTLLPSCGYALDSWDISNLVAMVSFMFDGGPELFIEDIDCNCDCEINIADLVCFVEYMFNYGVEPGCGMR